MRRRASAILVAGALLAGCTIPAPDRTAPDPVVTETTAATYDPVALIGNWWVSSTGEEEGTVLRLGSDSSDLSLWRRCGRLSGGWRADADGLFVGGVTGIIGCPVPPAGQPWTPAWLARVTGYRLDGGTAHLLDAGRAVVARLVPGGRPAPRDMAYLSPELARPPVVTAAGRQMAVPPQPLPAGLTPATRDTLTGRWVPADGVQRTEWPFVELRADGEWSGSDGCNGKQGRWVAGAAGTLLATVGPSTLAACENHPAASWLYKARRAAVDGDQLILFDVQAAEVGRLKRG